MTHNCIRIIAVLAVSLWLLTACAPQTPNLDRHFGETVSLIQAQQTLYPDASSNIDPVKGIDGKAAKSGYDEYQKSYKVPEQQASGFTIGVGGAR